MKNKKALATETLIKILILIIAFALIGIAIGYLLKRFGVV